MTERAMLSRQEAQVTLQNRLPLKHPERLALEHAIRSALAGLKGSWDVVLEVPEGLSLVVAVVAPDGSAWTTSCYNATQRDSESIAETVRAACSRPHWLDSGGAAGGKAESEVESPGMPAGLPNRSASKGVTLPIPNREAAPTRLASLDGTKPAPSIHAGPGGNRT